MPVHRWIFDVPNGWHTAAMTRSRRSPARRWSASGWLMLNVPSNEAMVIPRASAARRIRVTSPGGISSGIGGSPRSPYSVARNPAHSPSRHPIGFLTSDAKRPHQNADLHERGRRIFGSAAARNVGAHVAPTVRAPAALSQLRRVQRVPHSSSVWYIEHRPFTCWKWDAVTCRGSLHDPIIGFVDHSEVNGQLGTIQRSNGVTFQPETSPGAGFRILSVGKAPLQNVIASCTSTCLLAAKPSSETAIDLLEANNAVPCP